MCETLCCTAQFTYVTVWICLNFPRCWQRILIHFILLIYSETDVTETMCWKSYGLHPACSQIGATQKCSITINRLAAYAVVLETNSSEPIATTSVTDVLASMLGISSVSPVSFLILIFERNLHLIVTVGNISLQWHLCPCKFILRGAINKKLFGVSINHRNGMVKKAFQTSKYCLVYKIN